MGIYLDSAIIEDIKEAKNYPFLDGVTTNPKLIAAALKNSTVTEKEFLDHIVKIKDVVSKEIFVQTTFSETDMIISQAEKIHEVLGGQGIIKIPATITGFQSMKCLSEKNIRTAATAVYNPMQAYLAMNCGAEYIIPYFSRIQKNMVDGLELVADIMEIINNGVFDSKILVASIKKPYDVLELVRIGVWGVTIPIEMIGELMVEPRALQAVNEFRNALKVTC
ncbi:MAG: transaldolase family protein [Vulcanimicrobiota bacterium]